MSEMTLQELENTAEAYERLLAPPIFEPWTHRVADAAGIRAGQRVLDVACGTGVLTRTVAQRVVPEGSVVGLDPNPGMLAVARRIAPQIEWRQGEAESLPYPDDSFDAVVSQFGLMFFTDRVAALREMMRVLAPEGRLAVAVFDSLDNIPAYAAMVAVLQKVVGDGAAHALESPFVLGDAGKLLAVFREAGIASAEMATHHGTEAFPSVKDMVLADVDGWFPFAGIQLDEATLQRLVAESETALQTHVRPDGSVKFGVGAHIVRAAKA
ncbi:MAG: methyltransferase domain-containing protein [Gammaproteobacteria bacterium]|nr:methyltransferase domain-containing protein [Gammaproteobacteria bacterium]NIV50671.1 methyltransferase domain-containing protein [Gammaproteobacteria bacterium]NIV74440.1 methyltransferase domain-containing protein [Gammaproteobacteria bacterium]